LENYSAKAALGEALPQYILGIAGMMPPYFMIELKERIPPIVYKRRKKQT
jgi:hypothetical protein